MVEAVQNSDQKIMYRPRSALVHFWGFVIFKSLLMRAIGRQFETTSVVAI
jgi:hypothetical protein